MTKRALRVGGWLLLTALIGVAARQIDWTVALEAVAAARPAPLILAVFLNGMILVLATWQWLRFLPKDVSVPASTMFEILSVTSTVSNGGPVGAGAVTGVHLLATHGKVGHPVGVSVLLLDQLVEGLAKVSIVLLASAVVPIRLEYRAVAVTLFVGVPVLMGLLTFAAHRRQALEAIAARATGLWGRVARALHELSRNLDTLRRPTELVVPLILGLAQKMVEAFAIAAVIMALGVSVPWWGVVATLVAVNLSTLVSITPANLGVYEGSAFLVFTALGVDADMALALAIVQHVVYLIPLAGIGWVVSMTRPLEVTSTPSA